MEAAILLQRVHRGKGARMIAYDKREKKWVEREEAERKLEEFERQKAAFAPTGPQP